MGVLKYKDVEKMSEKEINEKIKELKLELMKSKVSDKSGKVNIRELKKAIARLLTFNRINKSEKTEKSVENK